MDCGGARGRGSGMRGKRLDLVQGVRLPAVVDLDHGIRETRPQLGRQLERVSPLWMLGQGRTTAASTAFAIAIAGLAIASTTRTRTAYLSNVTPRRGSLANGASIPRVSLDRALALGASLDLSVGHALS